jgi:hypothetical protein
VHCVELLRLLLGLRWPRFVVLRRLGLAARDEPDEYAER